MTKPPNGRVPFDSSNSKVIWTTVVGLELSFPTPYCSFPRLSLHHTACHSWLIPNPLGNLLIRVYVLYVSDLHLPSSFITRSEMSPPTASAAAPLYATSARAISLELRRDIATTSSTARSVRLYLTTITGLPKRYEAR